MDDQVTMVMGGVPGAGDESGNESDMVQYVIYSGDGDTPIGLEELRDALTKLTGQPVAFTESQDSSGSSQDQEIMAALQVEPATQNLSTVTQEALSQDNDLNFRLTAERMVGEVSFIDDSIIENRTTGDKSTNAVERSSAVSAASKLVIDDAEGVPISQLINARDQAQEQQIPSQIVIETEYGPITLDTSKLTQGQLDGTEQITVNLLTTDEDGREAKAPQQRGLRLPPGIVSVPAPTEIRLTGFPDSVGDETIQGSDFVSVLQQLTDLCSEQNPLPVVDGAESDPVLKPPMSVVVQQRQHHHQGSAVSESESAAMVLEDFIDLKFPDKQAGKVIEISRLENYLKDRYPGKIQVQSNRIQIQRQGQLVQPLKQTVCCAAHSELKNQEIRRKMLPIPLNSSKCQECNIELSNRKALRLHIQRYHIPDFKHVCQNRIKVIRQPFREEEIVLSEAAPIVVDSVHVITDSERQGKVYACAVCKVKFTSQREYFRHITTHGEKNVQCTACGRKFVKISSLHAHVAYVHNNKTQYQCRYCSHKFISNLSWREHEEKHRSPQRGTIRCLLCRCFVPQPKFRKHMALLHKIAHKPKLDCAFCGCRFKEPEYLSHHNRQFHNFEKNEHLCPMCYKAYPTMEERDSHILRYHSDEEIMETEVEFGWEPKDCYKRQCSRCGKIFKSYACLKQHYDQHGDEKNRCLMCEDEYHWIVNLDLHYKRAHAVDDLVKLGVQTPTMNLLRSDHGFELVSKIGRKFSSRLDLVGQTEDPEEDTANNSMSIDYDDTESFRSESIERVIETPIIVKQPPVRKATQTPAKKAKEGPVSVTPSKNVTYSSAGAKTKIIVRHAPSKAGGEMNTGSPKASGFGHIRQGKVVDREIILDNGKRSSPAIQRATALARQAMAMRKSSEVVMTETDDENTAPKSVNIENIRSKTTDIDKIRAPRYLDIVTNRMNTVINLARLWSRRERKLFHMKDEQLKMRRAAATIPKKRVAGEWEEMPLFLDGVSGKLVTTEGMAELWRERAQVFLDSLGQGQLINDYLPLYDVGEDKNKVIPQATPDVVDDNETPKMQTTVVEKPTPKPVISKPAAKASISARKVTMPLLPTRSKSGRPLKYTERARSYAKLGGEGSDSDEESVDLVVSDEEPDVDQDATAEVKDESDEETQEEVLEKPVESPEKRKRSPAQSHKKKVTKTPTKPKAPPVSEKAKEAPPRLTRSGKKGDVSMPDISKAKKALHARTKEAAATKAHPDTAFLQALAIAPRIIKGKRGRPPGFNPDRYCPFTKKARLIITDIREIIGDAKKVIVQMEADEPKRHWKKQTARKSFAKPQRDTRGSDKATSRDTRSAEKSKDRASTEQKTYAKKSDTTIGEDLVDGGSKTDKTDSSSAKGSRTSPKKNSEPEKGQHDKGSEKSSGKSSDSKTSKNESSKNASDGKRESKGNDSGPPTKRSKSSVKTVPSVIISPRAATLTPSRSSYRQRGLTTPIASKSDTKHVANKSTTVADSKKKKVSSPKASSKATPIKEKNSSPKKATKNDASKSISKLEIEISSKIYNVPDTDSPVPSSSSSSEAHGVKTVRKEAPVAAKLSADTKHGAISEIRKTIRLVLHDEEPATIRLVGSAMAPIRKDADEKVDEVWGALVGASPLKSTDSNHE